jgi:ubiquinone/menaquinone biosynthesis C-methylase UbiE
MKGKKTTDEYLSEMGYSLFDEFGRVLKLAAIPPGDLVFDAATGSGRMTRVLFEKGYQVISGDIGWQQLDALRFSQPFLGSQKIHWMQLDLYQLGFQDHCFDNIVCANLLHEVKHPETVLKELLRVFSGHGTLVLIDFTQHGFSVIDQIGRMRHGKGHNIHGSISCEVIRAFIKERLFHFEEIELPLNWAYVASGKI